MLRRFSGTWHPFDRASHVVIFLLGSCLAAAIVCGAIGTFSLWAGGFVPDDDVAITFVTFCLADAAGIAVFGTLALAWYREPQLDREIVLASSALIVVIVLSIAVLGAWSRYPVDYLFLPLLLWAGFRGGPRGVTLAAAAITVVTILATMYGVGSFVGNTANESILLLEGFMAVITFTGLLVVAVRAQQLEADAALEAHNRMLEQRVAERTAEVAEKNRLLEEKQARIDDDLKTAQVLQASILPTDFSAYPATGIAAFMKPALEVGGDFYDVFPLERRPAGLGGRRCVRQGRRGRVLHGGDADDAEGRGAGRIAALGLPRPRQRSAVPRKSDRYVRHRALRRAGREHRARCTFVNAGHCEPIVADAGGKARLLKRSGNPPLGVMPDRAFAERSFTLGAGRDAVSSTPTASPRPSNRDGDQFRVRRLLDIAQRFAGRSPQELMLAVIERRRELLGRDACRPTTSPAWWSAGIPFPEPRLLRLDQDVPLLAERQLDHAFGRERAQASAPSSRR